MLVPSDNKSVELTDKQKDFLDALFGEANGDPKIAGEIAGYSVNSYPKVLKSLKEEIIVHICQGIHLYIHDRWSR